jgi:hypothetical protein
MKKLTILMAVSLLLTSSIWAGVIKKDKSDINFAKFGTFKTEETVRISTMKKAVDAESDFKGKGIVGKLAGKFALSSGDTSRIIDLTSMSIYEINHKKKEYKVMPIEKLSYETGEGNQAQASKPESRSDEGNIKITRNEFKVEETGESKTINNFPSKKYIVTWLSEWENTSTGEKGTTRLVTDVWTTPFTDDIKQCQKEEISFSREHMKAMGIDLDQMQADILGTNWLSIFTQMGGEGARADQNTAEFSKEMKKIQGYPVVIDGKFYSSREGGEAEEKEEESGGGIGGRLGGLAKKALSKKSDKPDENQPSFSYYTEVIELHPASLDESAFQVPANYKKKD